MTLELMRSQAPLVATLAGTILFVALYVLGNELYLRTCLPSASLSCDAARNLLVAIIPASAGYTAGRLIGRHGVWYGALAGLVGIGVSALIDSWRFEVPFIFASVGDIAVWLSLVVSQSVVLSFLAGGVGELRSRIIRSDEF